MKKKIQIIILVIYILCILIISLDFTTFFISNKNINNESNWNYGFCEYDGQRLIYYGTSDKEIYICPLCGKYYKFNKVMSYKND